MRHGRFVLLLLLLFFLAMLSLHKPLDQQRCSDLLRRRRLCRRLPSENQTTGSNRADYFILYLIITYAKLE